MNFNELSNLVYKKYGLKFEPALPGSQELYLLKSPLDNSTFVMMSRIKRDNHFIATLDVRCGDFSEIIRDLPGFSTPFRLKSKKWVGIWLTQVKKAAIESALDYAFKLIMNGEKQAIDEQPFIYIPGQDTKQEYQAQKIKPRKCVTKKEPQSSAIPERIKKMMESYDYSIFPSKGRAKNFCHQGQMMANFDDDYHKVAAFKRFYPTYHDMNSEELRTYFTWRTNIRKKIYKKTSRSYAYVYIYELLNNIGVDDAQDGFEKIILFKKNYVEKYDPEIMPNLTKWLQDYAVYYHLTSKKEEVFKKELDEDYIYTVLLKPEDFSAEELFNAFLKLSPYLKNNVMLRKLGKEFAQVLYQVWLQVKAVRFPDKKDFFHKYIAQTNLFTEELFSNAVFYFKKTDSLEYIIDSKRKIFYQNNKCYYKSLIPLKRQKVEINIFLHEVDRLIRVKLHTGKELKAKKMDDIVLSAISKGIDRYLQLKQKAERPKIKINYSDLDKIRQDALVTCDSLLTEEELDFEDKTQSLKQDNESIEDNTENEYGLSEDEMFLLLSLLKNKSWQDYIHKKRLMTSILVDEINDKLFDEIGDAVIDFDENGQPKIITEYYSDLKEIFLGGH